MAVPFQIKGWVFGSPLFEVIAAVAGYSADEARMRWARAGSMCTERGTYVLTDALVLVLFGPKGIEALIAAELGERVDGGIRMLRMEGEIEWYASSGPSGTTSGLQQRQRAGQARADGAARDARGRLLPKSSGDQRTPAEPPADSPATSPANQRPGGVPLDPATPADIQRPPASLSPISEEDRNSPAPALAIPPLPADERIQLANEARDRLNAMRAEIAEANGWTDVHSLHPMDPGFSELRARILEIHDFAEARRRVYHVLEVMFAEARAKNTVEFLNGGAFEMRSWRKKLSMRVADAQRPSRERNPGRTATFGGSKARTDHPEEPAMRPASEVL